jgi:hypothetical protein
MQKLVETKKETGRGHHSKQVRLETATTQTLVRNSGKRHAKEGRPKQAGRQWYRGKYRRRGALARLAAARPTKRLNCSNYQSLAVV